MSCLISEDSVLFKKKRENALHLDRKFTSKLLSVPLLKMLKVSPKISIKIIHN